MTDISAIRYNNVIGKTDSIAKKELKSLKQIGDINFKDGVNAEELKQLDKNSNGTIESSEVDAFYEQNVDKLKNYTKETFNALIMNGIGSKLGNARDIYYTKLEGVKCKVTEQVVKEGNDEKRILTYTNAENGSIVQTKIVKGNKTTTIKYNANGKIKNSTEVTTKGDTTTTVEKNKNGKQTKKTVTNSTTGETKVYDGKNRLTSETKDGKTTNYTYDKYGNLEKIENEEGITKREIDNTETLIASGIYKGNFEADIKDANGNVVGSVIKDRDGNVLMERNFTFDNKGIKTGEISIEHNEDNSTRITTSDSSGNTIKEVYKSADGNTTSTWSNSADGTPILTTKSGNKTATYTLKEFGGEAISGKEDTVTTEKIDGGTKTTTISKDQDFTVTPNTSKITTTVVEDTKDTKTTTVTKTDGSKEITTENKKTGVTTHLTMPATVEGSASDSTLTMDARSGGKPALTVTGQLNEDGTGISEDNRTEVLKNGRTAEIKTTPGATEADPDIKTITHKTKNGDVPSSVVDENGKVKSATLMVGDKTVTCTVNGETVQLEGLEDGYTGTVTTKESGMTRIYIKDANGNNVKMLELDKDGKPDSIRSYGTYEVKDEQGNVTKTLTNKCLTREFCNSQKVRTYNYNNKGKLTYATTEDNSGKKLNQINYKNGTSAWESVITFTGTKGKEKPSQIKEYVQTEVDGASILEKTVSKINSYETDTDGKVTVNKTTTSKQIKEITQDNKIYNVTVDIKNNITTISDITEKESGKSDYEVSKFKFTGALGYSEVVYLDQTYNEQYVGGTKVGCQTLTNMSEINLTYGNNQVLTCSNDRRILEVKEQLHVQVRE